ncbi:sugar ABC transporter ATP-binding protein [Reinekea sp.]|uniref:sugar ABC transporter ATP-binding protein n=1 Tax=Reinekea sp. TaxID=1970455 RepID=UPI002A7FAE31|nr:sugar ABC transporter ATP-binding protein [Reinekea sp.]
MNKVVLTAERMTKKFPGVIALNEVSFEIRAGEVHALMGENGAGKSTLMKVLSGIYSPDGGAIYYHGERVTFASPKEARDRGILLVHQELSLSPELSAAENIYLGAWPTNRFGVLQKRKMNEQAKAALDSLGCNFGPEVRVGSLSIAKQQMVEIARTLAFNATVVIFDEPTGTLTVTEKNQLFQVIRSLRGRGVAIVYISHKMDEIFEITDRITVLRDGAVQGTVNTQDSSIGEITKKMIGRDLDQYFHRAQSTIGREVLKVSQLTKTGLFKDISFSVRAGEVVGIYGLIGAGRSEVAETLFGARQRSAGVVVFEGEEVAFSSPRDAIEKGMALVPEDRKAQGLILGLGGRHNTTLPHLDRFSEMGIPNVQQELAVFNEYKEKLDIKTTGPEQLVGDLSGGNQQKFVLAKWLCAEPKLIILDEPTRGIDVGSKSAIHQYIAELAERGLAVIVISSEMPEVIGVSHRILAMASGRLVGEFSGVEMTEQNLITAVSVLPKAS